MQILTQYYSCESLRVYWRLASEAKPAQAIVDTPQLLTTGGVGGPSLGKLTRDIAARCSWATSVAAKAWSLWSTLRAGAMGAMSYLAECAAGRISYKNAIRCNNGLRHTISARFRLPTHVPTHVPSICHDHQERKSST
ncbi:hypothetical protein HaLaN_19691 [Haematococcus lacustris]|uniref:Uncharacterized protein n=1 Tax=Haematococcus lacustris TaxID=44745 RepID=A0A699ZU82_HAELA|nr:hypothetical protein HaLaN_19691 [Haematococcus lacustris]